MASLSRRGFLSTSIGFSASVLAALRSEPDAILHNAKVWTGSASFPEAQAIAVSGGRILALGTNAETLALAASGTKKYDCAGKRVTPG
jgi:predicted amidohydrolase YtcJ